MKRRNPKRRDETDRTEGTDVNERTESLRNKGSVSQSARVTDETQETHEVPPLATRVATLQEAVRIALDMGVGENCLFNFARALMAFEVTTKFRLSPDQREQAFL